MSPMQGLPRLYPARTPWQAELRFSFTGYSTYPLRQAKLATPDDFVLGQYSLDQPGGHLRSEYKKAPDERRGAAAECYNVMGIASCVLAPYMLNLGDCFWLNNGRGLCQDQEWGRTFVAFWSHAIRVNR
ncbi:hypothetical protein C8J57DRAFT_1241678 [Mycena rebaudengoi]|nr:hypothetical protein C8J57DRAFT_1242492 [Mycena rebaudengoi]KAJ7246221.1 hypothetical protein C8J57DRAFT_1241678 [Mycena rebaudengoi]